MLKLEEGSILRRIWAYMIDLIILVIPIGIIAATIPVVSRSGAILLVLAICLEQYLYFFLLTWLNKGRSIGQKLFKLQVMGVGASSTLDIKSALLHSIGKIIYLILLDLLIGVIIGKYQLEERISRFSQRLAHTKVVVRR